MREYSQALNRAALRHYTIAPKKANPKAGTRPMVFLFGRDDTDLTKLHKNSLVWSLASYPQLLQEHTEANIIVFKKGYKRGIIGAQVDGGPRIRRAYQRPIGIGVREYLGAYYWVNDYLASYGVSFTSSSWASEQVFRLGFKKPLKLSNPLGRHLLRPSRGVCYPGLTYKGAMEKWDIRSAYPSAMLDNAHVFPTKAIPIDADDWQQHKVTLTFARVIARPSIPDRELPVIQVHATDTENPGVFHGWFWRFELETIADQYHDIKPIISFKYQTADLSDEIGAWQQILSPRYEGTVFAGQILKSVANALWGSFTSGHINAYTWTVDEWGNVVTDQYLRQMYGGKVGGEHIAAWNNALVSDRVFNEFIEPETVLYFDTDGGFCRPAANRLGNGDFGQWKFEGYYRKLKVVGWQAYAAWNDDGRQVVLSGVPDASYSDLIRYGDDDNRTDYISQLMEPIANEMSRISTVDPNNNRAYRVPYDWAKETISGPGWGYIIPEIAPHVSHFAKFDSNGRIILTDRQTAALMKLSEIRLDNGDDPDSMGGVTTSDKERMVTENGNYERQGRLGL